LRLKLPYSNFELWEKAINFTLETNALWENGYPMVCETGIAVNYKPFPSFAHNFNQESIKKCGTFQSYDNEIFKITHCGRCYKLIKLNFDDEFMHKENCTYHPGRTTFEAFSDDKYWTCCNRSEGSPGCVTGDTHVWNGVVRGLNEFLDWKGYIATERSVVRNIEDFQIYGLDCEMCYTREGLEATQITIVDVLGNVLYRTYIKPETEIIDYNSAYSGIYENTLANIDITLSEVQETLKEHIHEDTILVGHSLDNDLRALRISHKNCIDTSLLFPHRIPNYRHSLRYLALEHLSRKIRYEGRHSSIEDARTTMDLFFQHLINLYNLEV